MSSPPGSPSSVSLGRRERIVLAAVAALLAVALVWLRGGLHPEAPLENLARRSPDLQEALGNGRPTLVEFYADWCEACRAMAPAMEQMERRHRDRLDVVLLNVDNPRWQSELERYDVNGIPHLQLFDAAGRPRGHALGGRSEADLEAIAVALREDAPLPALAGVGAVSRLEQGDATPAAAGPRSHG
jgi:thiol:disulfide interchange protein